MQCRNCSCTQVIAEAPPSQCDFSSCQSERFFYYTQSGIFDAMLKEYKIQFIFAQIFWIFEFLFFRRTSPLQKAIRLSLGPRLYLYTNIRYIDTASLE